MLPESQPGKDWQPLLFLRSLRLWELTPTSPKLRPKGPHPASDNAPRSCDRLATTSPKPPPGTESQIPPAPPSVNPRRTPRTPTTVNSTPKLAPDLPRPCCPENPANALLSVCPSLTGVPCPLSRVPRPSPHLATAETSQEGYPRPRGHSQVPLLPGSQRIPKAPRRRLTANPFPHSSRRAPRMESASRTAQKARRVPPPARGGYAPSSPQSCCCRPYP